MIDYTSQQIGNYRLIRRLGIGGFASVYQGQHIRIAAQQAAIKILHLSDVDIQKFQQEAETTATLVHPNIIRLFDFDLANGIPFLVMDFAPGGSLRTRHPHRTHLPLPTVVEYVKVLANALQFAHDKNIIHRDMKPENVLIGTYGELRLSDFGIAVLSQTGRTTLDPAYGTGGTPFYMAPEQCKGRPEKASDQYALAIMAYEWLCGLPPFTEGNAINIQFQHTYVAIPSLRGKLPLLPEAVEQVILTALAKNPKERFATIQAFALALEEAVQREQAGSSFSKPGNPRRENLPPQHVMPIAANNLPLTSSKQGNQLRAAQPEIKETIMPGDGEAVLQRVYLGHIPSDWKVHYISRGALFVCGTLAVIFGVIGLIIGMRLGGYYALGGVAWCILLLAVTVGVYIAKNEVLVLMPGGVVSGNPKKQTVSDSIDYRYAVDVRADESTVHITTALPGEERKQTSSMQLMLFANSHALAQTIERMYLQFKQQH